jgi:non-canonical poly(A) RNA polymerase PAPD5/7
MYVSKALTPIIKMKHRETGFSIDISLNHIDGIKQVKEVEKMKIKYPEFKFIVFVMKTFLKLKGYSETYSGGIGSYLLILMIYHNLR